MPTRETYVRRGAGIVAAVMLLGLLVPLVPHRATAAPTWWTPTPATALPLHWALDNGSGPLPVDTANGWHVGERSRGGAVLTASAVLDIEGEFNSATQVATLHGRGQKVICYFDAGVYEDYRSDASSFPPSVIGNPDGNWAGSW